MFCFWLRTILNGNPGIRITKSFQLLFHIFCSYCSLSQHACARCSCRTRNKRVILVYPVLQTESPTTRNSGGVCVAHSHSSILSLVHPHGPIIASPIIICTVILCASWINFCKVQPACHCTKCDKPYNCHHFGIVSFVHLLFSLQRKINGRSCCCRCCCCWMLPRTLDTMNLQHFYIWLWTKGGVGKYISKQLHAEKSSTREKSEKKNRGNV